MVETDKDREEREALNKSYTEAWANSTTVIENTVTSMADMMKRSATSMAETTIKIDPCAADKSGGISRQAFAKWREHLMAAMGALSSLSSSEKLCYLRRHAGEELLATLESLELSEVVTDVLTPFESTLKKLDTHFESEEFNIMARLKFTKTKQIAKESNKQFLIRMLKDSKWCGFAKEKLQFELVLAIAMNAANIQIRTAASSVGCTYNELMKLASAIDLQETIEKENAPAKAPLHVVTEKPAYQGGYQGTSRFDRRDQNRENRYQPEYRRANERRYQENYGPSFSPRNPSHAQDKRGNDGRNRGGNGSSDFAELCYCCGYRGHQAVDCRKRYEHCRVCQKQGHLEKMCNEKGSKQQSHHQGQPKARSAGQFSVVLQEETSDNDKVNNEALDSEEEGGLGFVKSQD